MSLNLRHTIPLRTWLENLPLRLYVRCGSCRQLFAPTKIFYQYGVGDLCGPCLFSLAQRRKEKSVMKTKLLALLAILALAPLVAPHADEIDDLCSQRWGNDYEMRLYCIQKQTEARTQIVARSPAKHTYEAIHDWLRSNDLPLSMTELQASEDPKARKFVSCEEHARGEVDRLGALLECVRG